MSGLASGGFGAAGVTAPCRAQAASLHCPHQSRSDFVAKCGSGKLGKNVFIFRAFWSFELWIKDWGPAFSSFWMWLKVPSFPMPSSGEKERKGRSGVLAVR